LLLLRAVHKPTRLHTSGGWQGQLPLHNIRIPLCRNHKSSTCTAILRAVPITVSIALYNLYSLLFLLWFFSCAKADRNGTLVHNKAQLNIVNAFYLRACWRTGNLEPPPNSHPRPCKPSSSSKVLYCGSKGSKANLVRG
jgi:hypothetical protein